MAGFLSKLFGWLAPTRTKSIAMPTSAPAAAPAVRPTRPVTAPTFHFDHVIWPIDPPLGAENSWDIVIDFGTSATTVLGTTTVGRFGREWSWLVSDLDPSGRRMPILANIVMNAVSGDVEAVGAAARNYAHGVDTIEWTSIKRYIEDAGTSPYMDVDGEPLHQHLKKILTRYLGRVFEQATLDIGSYGPGTSVIASVPNNATAQYTRALQSAIREAVSDALTRNLKHRQTEGGPVPVWARQLTRIELRQDQIRLIPEGVAVAYARLASQEELVSFTSLLDCDAWTWGQLRLSPAGDGAPELETATEGNPASSGTILVIDAGAGTVDVTLIEPKTTGGGRRVPVVRLNVGIPIAGDDVDRILLAAFTTSTESWCAGPPNAVRATVRMSCISATLDARRLKESAAGSMLGRTPWSKQDIDSFFNKQARPDGAYAEAPARAQSKLQEKLTRAVEAPMKGLIALASGLSAPTEVVLTGRGSQLGELRRAVLANVPPDCRVVTPALSLHLKLAVALGCGLASGASDDDAQSWWPTLGREFEVVRPRTEPALAVIPSHLPATSRGGTCLQMKLREVPTDFTESLVGQSCGGLNPVHLRLAWKLFGIRGGSNHPEIPTRRFWLWDETRSRHVLAHEDERVPDLGQRLAPLGDPDLVSGFPIGFPFVIKD